jgi:hypothetical protein
MAGRKFIAGRFNERRDGTPLHLYLPGQHRDVWKWAGARKLQKIILCESLIKRGSWDAY